MTTVNQQYRGITPEAKRKFALNLLGGAAATLILAIVFFFITRSVLLNQTTDFDRYVTETVRQAASPTLTAVVTWITHIGSSRVVVPLAGILIVLLAFVFKRRWDAMSLLTASLGGALVNEGLKLCFRRARPDWEHWVVEHGYSFPSGHSMVSTAFFGMVGYLIWMHLKEQGKPAGYVLVLTALLIICIGLSRIYLGVHYVTDVLGGFTAGAIWLLFTIMAMQWLRDRKKGTR